MHCRQPVAAAAPEQPSVSCCCCPLPYLLAAAAASAVSVSAVSAAHLPVCQLLLLGAEQVPVQRGVLEQPSEPSRHN
jgi:hypothetical protein